MPIREQMIVTFFAVLVLISGSARANAIFHPPTVTDQNRIRADFFVRGGCTTTISTLVGDASVRVEVISTHCIVLPGFVVPAHVTFGPLRANTYSFEIYERLEGDPPQLQSRQTLIVAATAPAVPTLDYAALTGIIIMCAFIAVATIGRNLNATQDFAYCVNAGWPRLSCQLTRGVLPAWDAW